MTTMVKITVQLPYPKEFEFREDAGSVWTAVSRSMRQLRKQLKGRRIKNYKIDATIL